LRLGIGSRRPLKIFMESVFVAPKTWGLI
jgi:hypothetical protein